MFDVLFDDKGKRIENVVFAPQSTLDQRLSCDQGDFEDIRHRLPFVLTTDEIRGIQHSLRGAAAGRRTALLRVRYRAQEDCRQEALLSGTHLGRRPRLSDREDLRQDACPTSGKKKRRATNICIPSSRPGGSRSMACTGSRSIPRPTTNCTSRLGDIHIREIVKYEDYKRFGSNVKILYEGKEIPKGQRPRTRISRTRRSRTRRLRTPPAEVGFKFRVSGFGPVQGPLLPLKPWKDRSKT